MFFKQITGPIATQRPGIRQFPLHRNVRVEFGVRPPSGLLTEWNEEIFHLRLYLFVDCIFRKEHVGTQQPDLIHRFAALTPSVFLDNFIRHSLITKWQLMVEWLLLFRLLLFLLPHCWCWCCCCCFFRRKKDYNEKSRGWFLISQMWVVLSRLLMRILYFVIFCCRDKCDFFELSILLLVCLSPSLLTSIWRLEHEGSVEAKRKCYHKSFDCVLRS